MDKLTQIFQMQNKFDERVMQRCIDEDRPVPCAADKCTAIIHEACELRDELNWKWWKSWKPTDKGKALEEAVDILHFWVSCCLDLGFTADQVFQAYLRKNAINHVRQEQGY